MVIFRFYFKIIFRPSDFTWSLQVTWSEDDFVIKSKYHHFTFCLVSYITRILSLQDDIF